MPALTCVASSVMTAPARDLRSGAGGGGHADQRDRRRLVGDPAARRSAGTARPGRPPAGRPWRCPSTTRRRARRRVAAATPSAARQPARPARRSARRRPSRTHGAGQRARSQPRRRARSRPGRGPSPGTAGGALLGQHRRRAVAATPSPKRILTGRWFRKGAIIGVLSDRVDGVADGNVAGLDDIGVDARQTSPSSVRRYEASTRSVSRSRSPLSGFMVISEHR